MALRSNLFIKVFAAFWLLTIMILGSWLLTSNYFESRPPGLEYAQQRSPAPPHRLMTRVIYTLENADDGALSQVVDDMRSTYGIQVYLLDRGGVDLLGREVPEKVRRIARRLREDRRRALMDTPQGRLAAHEIFRPGTGVVKAVFIFPSPRGFLLNVLGSNLWLRIGLAVLLSGAFCFVLSRVMTKRIRNLQLASRRLANGDLQTRLQVRDHGGDETDELARDFNSMAAQLQARTQAQKRLLGDVSHELRSPLARLRVALALAQEKTGTGKEYLPRIEREAERLEELIGQLLASQAQDVPLDTHIDLVPLLQQLCADANFEGQGAGKRFVFHADAEQAIVDSAGDLLRKCFENILRNALQHTRDNSRVTVSLVTGGGSYFISVEDQGPGVPEQDLDNIFAEFYRVDTARTQESGGHGLGLAITRRAVMQHGGDVTAHNTPRGLIVTVRLPAHN